VIGVKEVISACQNVFVQPITVRVIEIIRDVLNTLNPQFVGIKKLLRDEGQVFFRPGASILRKGE
jgi:hypothetical protein